MIMYAREQSREICTAKNMDMEQQSEREREKKSAYTHRQ